MTGYYLHRMGCQCEECTALEKEKSGSAPRARHIPQIPDDATVETLEGYFPGAHHGMWMRLVNALRVLNEGRRSMTVGEVRALGKERLSRYPNLGPASINSLFALIGQTQDGP